MRKLLEAKWAVVRTHSGAADTSEGSILDEHVQNSIVEGHAAGVGETQNLVLFCLGGGETVEGERVVVLDGVIDGFFESSVEDGQNGAEEFL